MMGFFLFVICFFNMSLVAKNIETKDNAFNICSSKKILLNYKDEELSTIINKIAAIKNINILFPQDENFSVKLNYSSKDETTIDEAWNFILTVLDIAGYNGVFKKDIYQIVNSTNILKEPLEVYINVNVDDLPNSSQKIRYLYNFQNLNIASGSTVFSNLDQILKDMLPTDGSYLLDSVTNTLLIMNKSSDIKSAMKIISELDKTGIRETIEVIPLLYTKPNYISQIITQLVTSPDEQKFGFFPVQQKKGLYFSENAKVLPIDAINAVAILGPTDSVKYIKKLITKYLDRPIESAKSIIHIRPLEYIDSNDIAPIIQSLVKAKLPQAQAEVKDELANAIIINEQQVTTDTLKPTESGDSTASTGNNPIPGEESTEVNKKQLASGSNALIVSARGQDWVEINNLIEKLDTQQLQVAVDVIIAEIDFNLTKDLGAQTRNINNSNGQPQTFNYQTANLSGPILNTNNDGTINIARGLAANLLEPIPGQSAVTNLATTSVLGSFMASYQDSNGVAYFLRGLDSKENSDILFRGYSCIKNNEKGTLSLTQERFFPGEAQAQMAGAFRIVNKPVKATIAIDIVPTISQAGTVNMDITVKANVFDRFISDQVNKRELYVKANVNNKEVLVLGGLMTHIDSLTIQETPILSKIPIIGNFFKRTQCHKEKHPIYIFILPTIIKPKLQGGYNSYTKSKIDMLKHELITSEEALLGKNFAQLKDPITKFFLPTSFNEFNKKIDDFIGPQELQSKNSPLSSKISKIMQNLKDDEKYKV